MLKLTTRLQYLTAFMSIGAFAISFHQPANAQRITGFTEEIENFPFQLHDIIKGQLSKEEEAQSVEFAQFWSTDYFAPEKKAEIVEISNLLLKKTDVNLSHFVSLMKILLNLKYNEQIQKSFDTWLNGLKMYAEDPNIVITTIIKFIQNSQSIFENNILKIRQKRGIAQNRLSKEAELALNTIKMNIIYICKKQHLYAVREGLSAATL